MTAPGMTQKSSRKVLVCKEEAAEEQMDGVWEKRKREKGACTQFVQLEQREQSYDQQSMGMT
ncbi:hypothetical protein CDL15_Pgr013254 [Punica granatum]|uniref:Uncharacterized protein n=1 Tax=Punica granatum TaxID=22663 RepID=A0A218WPQ8_PUNGR|nr:hypothetical protein CDL15_Pgr013254 [Punica granatum]